jgi:ribosome-associated protein
MNSASLSRPVHAGPAMEPLVEIINTCIDDAKGEDIVTIDLTGKTAIADAMVIASGRSKRHVAAIAEQLLRALKEKGYRELRVEGLETGEWVLIDAGDVIVHVFQPEIRDFYNLEKMWSAARPDPHQA